MDRYYPDLNTVTKEELEMIPGITDETAEAIVRYRNEVGGIESFEELTNVEGITQNHVDHLRPWLHIA